MSIATAARWLLAPARRKWVMAAITVAVLTAALVTCRDARQDAQEARTEAEVAQAGVVVLEGARRADNGAVEAREATRNAIRMEEEVHRVQTEEALAAHPAWSDQPVPRDVLGSLRD